MATDDRLLYEARTVMVPEAFESPNCHKALHFIIEGRNFDCLLCKGNADDLEFWQALASLWERAPLMQLCLKEARDAILQMTADTLGIASAPYIGDQYTHWDIRHELLGRIERALAEPTD